MDGGIRRHHLTLVVPGLLQHRPGDRGATEGPQRSEAEMQTENTTQWCLCLQ